MDVLDELGVEPVLNAAGPSTRLGGGLLAESTIEAMARVARVSVPVEALQGAASRVLREVTGAEAGYVTSGAAAALTLAAAACLSGLDPRRMERLPDTRGMPNEIIVFRSQRNGYDHALRAAGAHLVEVGMDEVAAGAGCRQAEAWEIEAAITETTAAVAYFAADGAHPSLADVAEVTSRRGVPLIVDAAAQLPPVANLRRFIAAGADLVAFSGGKAIAGPQGTGVLVGRRELVMSAALQCLDLDEVWELWQPPPELIDKALLRGLPRHGVGRGLKVAKEELVGILVALRDFAAHDEGAAIAAQVKLLEVLQRELGDLPGIDVDRTDGRGHGGTPLLRVRVDERVLGRSALDVAARLRDGSPRVYLGVAELGSGTLVANPVCLDHESAAVVGRLLRAAVLDGAHGSLDT